MNFKKTEKNTLLLKHIIEDSFGILCSNLSRSEALKKTAELAIADFGDYMTPGSLNLKDEVHILLVELLDQIIYEFRENHFYDNNIRDYIIDDLFSRLMLMLEALNSPQHYLKNIANRALYHDDLVIIKQMKLAELIPMLISESGDITNLQVQIIKTLLCFTDDTPLDFFYNSLITANSDFIRAASMLGLKYKSSNCLNWNAVKKAANGSEGFAIFAESFIADSPSENRLPESPEEIIFSLLHIEKTAPDIGNIADMDWILSVIEAASNSQFDNVWAPEVYSTIGNIVLNLDIDLSRAIFMDEKKMIRAACIIDRLPKNIFNRITGRLDELGMEIIFKLNSVIEKKKVPVNEYNSNLVNYLCSNNSINL